MRKAMDFLGYKSLAGLILYLLIVVLYFHFDGEKHIKKFVRRIKSKHKGTINNMTHGLFFSYLRNERNQPAVAIAILTTPGSSKVSFQLATRNPKDNFNKIHARAAAGGRLAKHPITLDMGVTDSKQTDILLKIVNTLIESNFSGIKGGPITHAVLRNYATMYNTPAIAVAG